jgi:translation initiation factor 1
VTVVSGLQLPPTELRDLAKALKRRCGTGGAIKDENIEIQGDQRDTVIEELEERGLRVKRTGG